MMYCVSTIINILDAIKLFDSMLFYFLQDIYSVYAREENLGDLLYCVLALCCALCFTVTKNY